MAMGLIPCLEICRAMNQNYKKPQNGPNTINFRMPNSCSQKNQLRYVLYNKRGLKSLNKRKEKGNRMEYIR